MHMWKKHDRLFFCVYAIMYEMWEKGLVPKLYPLQEHTIHRKAYAISYVLRLTPC